MQVENKQLRGKAKFDNQFHKRTTEHYEKALINWTIDIKKLEASQEALGKTFNKLADNQQKLKTGSRMLDDWEKSTTHPDSTLVNIRNLKKVFTQNTDYVQKEEAT